MKEKIRQGIGNGLDRVKSLCGPVSEMISEGVGNVSAGMKQIPVKFRERYEALSSGSRMMQEKLKNYFVARMDKYRQKYDADKLFRKIGEVAATAGSNVVYMVLVLYYSLLGKNVPLKDRAMVIAALGYFISPIDFLPDILGMMGFADDFGVLMLVFRKIRDNVTPEVHLKAKSRLKEWFGEDSVAKVKI